MPVALVTGASRGIGRDLAGRLVSKGYQVVGCSRSESDLELDGYHHKQVDVRDEEAVKTLVSWIGSEFGSLYAVINNAGAASMNHAFLTPDSTVEKLLSTNVRGTFTVSREAAKLMRTAKQGRIVNISTIAVPLRLDGQAAYVAAKAAVERMSQVLAQEFGPFGITVNVVGPTPIDTDMTRGVPKKKMEALINRFAIRRMGTFEDVANVVDFFLRPESEAVTGQILYLGGVPN